MGDFEGGGGFGLGGGSAVGSGFSINLPGVSDATSNLGGLVSSGSGVADDLSSQVLDGSAFAEIGSDVAAANGSMQDGLSNGLNQTMGLLDTLNTNVQASASGYDQLDAAIADGFGGIGAGGTTGTFLTDGSSFTDPGSSFTDPGTSFTDPGTSYLGSGTFLANSTNDGLGALATDDYPDPLSAAAATPSAIPDPGSDPAVVNSWWNSMTPADQQAVTDANPAAVGELDGVPVAVRSYANQQVLAGEIEQTQAQISALQNGPLQPIPGDLSGMAAIENQQQQISSLQTQLGGLQALQNSVKPLPAFPTADMQAADTGGNYLINVDTNGLGHAIVAVNNPDFASNVATLVPGVGANLSSSNVNSYVGDASALVNSANLAGQNVPLTPLPQNNSAIAWMNYNAPQSVPAALPSGPAQQAAPALDQFQNGLYQTNVNGPDLYTTVIGHSYGSVVIGNATQQPGGLAANNVVAIGSPGMDVNNANNLMNGMNPPDGLPPQVFASRDSNDAIVWVEGFHNTDPATPGFGAQVFDSGAGPAGSALLGGTSSAAHGYYFQPGSPGMTNMGQIITGNLQNVTAPRPPASAPPMMLPVGP